MLSLGVHSLVVKLNTCTLVLPPLELSVNPPVMITEPSSSVVEQDAMVASVRTGPGCVGWPGLNIWEVVRTWRLSCRAVPPSITALEGNLTSCNKGAVSWNTIVPRVFKRNEWFCCSDWEISIAGLVWPLFRLVFFTSQLHCQLWLRCSSDTAVIAHD